MSRSSSVAFGWRWWRLGMGVLVVCACNAVTGVNDIEFGESAAPSSAGSAGTADPPQQTGMGTVTNPLQPACDAIAGTGCLANQTCKFDRTTAAGSCVPASASPREAYSACTEDGDCAAAHLCVAGVCSRLCETAMDCGWANARCVMDGSGQFSRCTRSCDLINVQSPRAGLQSCGDGLRCDFVPEAEGTGYTDCSLATGTSFDGSACKVSADCPVGFNCRRERCAPACDPDGAACPSGGSCTEVASLAGQSLGSCCGIPAGQTCNLVGDCGCGAGQTCASDNAGATECRTLPATPQQPYGACTEHAECPSGHSCIGSTCKQHCQTLDDCGEAGVACRSVTLDTGPIPGFSFCSRGCDLLTPEAPGPGLRSCGPQANCVLSSPVTDCGAAGPGVQSSSCEFSEDCSAGFICFRGTCEQWCDPNSSVCGAGLFCGVVINAAGRDLGSCCRPPTGQVCDWVTDCGCSASETCASDVDNVRFCRAVAANPEAPYALCSSDAECPQGHSCLGNNCMSNCSANSDCGVGIQCLPLSTGIVETQVTGACARNCDLLSPASPAVGFQPCAAGLTCLEAAGIDGDGTFCSVPGTGGVGDDCTLASDCGVAMGCEQGQCLLLCALGSTCADGEACSARAAPSAPAGGRTIGVCAL